MGTGLLTMAVTFIAVLAVTFMAGEIGKRNVRIERLMQHNQQLNDAVVDKAAKYEKLAELHNELISEKNRLVTKLGEAEAERDEIKQKYDSDTATYTGIRYKLSDLTAENERLKKLLNKKKWL